MTIPPALPDLIATYQDKDQGPVTFRPTSWRKALGPDNPALAILADERYTWQDDPDSPDRLIDRRRVHDHADAVDLADDEGLLRAFLLTQVWGGRKERQPHFEVHRRGLR